MGKPLSKAAKNALVFVLVKHGTNKVDGDHAAVWLETMLRSEFKKVNFALQ